MIETIYIEKDIADHPRTRQVCEQLPRARKIHCERYTEVFNPKAQNFRLQKQAPALSLARKFDHFVRLHALHDLVGMALEDLHLGACEVVLRKMSDLLEQI